MMLRSLTQARGEEDDDAEQSLALGGAGRFITNVLGRHMLERDQAARHRERELAIVTDVMGMARRAMERQSASQRQQGDDGDEDDIVRGASARGAQRNASGAAAPHEGFEVASEDVQASRPRKRRLCSPPAPPGRADGRRGHIPGETQESTFRFEREDWDNASGDVQEFCRSEGKRRRQQEKRSRKSSAQHDRHRQAADRFPSEDAGGRGQRGHHGSGSGSSHRDRRQGAEYGASSSSAAAPQSGRSGPCPPMRGSVAREQTLSQRAPLRSPVRNPWAKTRPDRR